MSTAGCKTRRARRWSTTLLHIHAHCRCCWHAHTHLSLTRAHIRSPANNTVLVVHTSTGRRAPLSHYKAPLQAQDPSVVRTHTPLTHTCPPLSVCAALSHIHRCCSTYSVRVGGGEQKSEEEEEEVEVRRGGRKGETTGKRKGKKR